MEESAENNDANVGEDGKNYEQDDENKIVMMMMMMARIQIKK